jgi:hypothetical protein
LNVLATAAAKSTQRRLRMKIAGLLSVMMLLAGLASSCASSKGQADILRMIADAKTPADHEAIAEYYDLCLLKTPKAAKSLEF